MHIYVICDLDACICDAGFFRYQRTNERTNEPTDKAILGVGLGSVLLKRESFKQLNEMGENPPAPHSSLF